MAAGGLIRTAAVVAAGALALAGCSDDGGDPEPSTTAAPAGPLDGGGVRLGLPGPIVLDPVAANPGSPAELMVADLLHDGLTALGPGGEVEPALATTWSADEAFATWTFQLDEAATFTDGTTVTAEAVVASLTRVAATAPAPLASLRLEAVVGYDQLVAGDADTLAGITAPDATTVEIRTSVPMATLPAVLAAPEMGIVAAGAEDPDLDALVLSGAWEPLGGDDGTLSLGRRREAAGHLDEVALVPFDDPDEAYDAFEGGEVDWALVPGSAHDEAVEAHGDEHFAPFHAEVFLGLRVAGPPLDAAPLRTAIAAAIDREDLVAEVYADVADPLATVVPTGVPGHEPAACGDADACAYDPAVAEAALAAAFPDGDVPTVAVDFDDGDRQQALAEAVAADLEAVGVPVELRPRSRGEYRAFVTSGAQQLFSLGWIGGYASPDAYLAPLFGSAADDNLTGVASAELDAALAAARSTDDPAVAEAAWRKVEAQVLGTAVVVPLAQFRTQAVVAERVQELAHRVDGTVDWAGVWVADGRSDADAEG